MTNPTPEQLAYWRKVDAERTQGRWKMLHEGTKSKCRCAQVWGDKKTDWAVAFCDTSFGGEGLGEKKQMANAAFIAAASEAVPALLSRVAADAETIEGLRGALINADVVLSMVGHSVGGIPMDLLRSIVNAKQEAKAALNGSPVSATSAALQAEQAENKRVMEIVKLDGELIEELRNEIRVAKAEAGRLREALNYLAADARRGNGRMLAATTGKRLRGTWPNYSHSVKRNLTLRWRPTTKAKPIAPTYILRIETCAPASPPSKRN